MTQFHPATGEALPDGYSVCEQTGVVFNAEGDAVDMNPRWQRTAHPRPQFEPRATSQVDAALESRLSDDEIRR